MLRYKLYQSKRENSPMNGKWYAHVQLSETLTLEDLAKHMSNHNSPYSEGLIYGILTDMIDCISELVLDGKAVKIPNLAIFSLGIKTKPADKPEDFSVTKNVEAYKLRSRATGDLTSQALGIMARAKEQVIYSHDAGSENKENTENENNG